MVSTTPSSSMIPVNNSVLDLLGGDADAGVGPVADDGGVLKVESHRVADGGDPEVPDGRDARTQQCRRDVADHLIDEACCQEGRGQRRPALDQHVLTVLAVQLRERFGRCLLYTS